MFDVFCGQKLRSTPHTWNYFKICSQLWVSALLQFDLQSFVLALKYDFTGAEGARVEISVAVKHAVCWTWVGSSSDRKSCSPHIPGQEAHPCEEDQETWHFSWCFPSAGWWNSAAKLNLALRCVHPPYLANESGYSLNHLESDWAGVNKVYQDGPSQEPHWDVEPKGVMPTENLSSKSLGVVLSVYPQHTEHSKGNQNIGALCILLFSVKN